MRPHAPQFMRSAKSLSRTLDELLRGRFTRPADLAEGRLLVSLRSLSLCAVVLGLVYGGFMGLYAVLRPHNASAAQWFATSVKVPALFLLTLMVTFPSLYVFSALAGSLLPTPQTLRLLLAAITVNLALLASLGPVTAFFTLSTESYPFMVLLNVLFFGGAGLGGLYFLRRALGCVFRSTPTAAPPAPAAAAAPGPVAAEPLRARVVFWTWMVIFGVVGAQMAWILRPFLGSPDLPFQWFRQRESNVFLAIARAVQQLFS